MIINKQTDEGGKGDMEDDRITKLKVRGAFLSGVSAMYLYLIYMAAMLVLVLVLGLLVHFVPALKAYDRLLMIPGILVLAVLLGHFLAGLYTVDLKQEAITVRWCGIAVRRLPVSELRLFCAFGNEREDVLCFSCRSVEEMAQLQEERLLRSLLHKYEVPFRKRRADHQAVFAREYLCHLRNGPFGAIKDRDPIMLQMRPEVQYLIRHMYPQLPYRNLTTVTSCYASGSGFEKEDRAVCGLPPFCAYAVALEPDGIHLFEKTREVSFIPAREIRSAIRVDVFRGYDKYHPHHMPLLFISGSTVEELSGQASSDTLRKVGAEIPDRQALLAMMVATDRAQRWRVRHKGCCVLHHTQKNEQKLRTLYPDIDIDDIAANWICDAGPFLQNACQDHP